MADRHFQLSAGLVNDTSGRVGQQIVKLSLSISNDFVNGLSELDQHRLEDVLNQLEDLRRPTITRLYYLLDFLAEKNGDERTGGAPLGPVQRHAQRQIDLGHLDPTNEGDE